MSNDRRCLEVWPTVEKTVKKKNVYYFINSDTGKYETPRDTDMFIDPQSNVEMNYCLEFTEMVSFPPTHANSTVLTEQTHSMINRCNMFLNEIGLEPEVSIKKAIQKANKQLGLTDKGTIQKQIVAIEAEMV